MFSAPHHHPQITGLSESNLLNSKTIFSEIQDSLYIMTFLMLSSAWCIIDRVFRREFIGMAPDENARLYLIDAVLPALLFTAEACTFYVHKDFLVLVILTIMLIAVHILRTSGSNLARLNLKLRELRGVIDREGRAAQNLVTPILRKQHLVGVRMLLCRFKPSSTRTCSLLFRFS